MRLRHKKPLNPYKGQTNNDKSEFNDDDFNQQGSPLKRTANGNNDQTFKYARILAKFVNTINEDFRVYAAQNPNPAGHTALSYDNQPPLNESESRREYTPFKSQQINQRKQKLRTQTKKQTKEAKKEIKTQLKKKEAPKTYPNMQENRNRALENSIGNSLEPTKNMTGPKMQTEIRQKYDRNENSIKNEAQKNANKTLQSQLANKINQTFPNGMNGITPNINNPNLANFENMQTFLNYSYPSLLGQSQMLPNYYSMQMAQQMRFPMDNSIQNYLPNLQLQLNMKFLNMGLPSQLLVHQNNLNLKPFQNLFSEQVKASNTHPPQSKPNVKQVYPIKRSAFHAAIAYKIYLDKLKKSGRTFQNLEEIDPTRNARRIKNNQGNSKSKDNLKKRK